ncbi:hypothetical protein Syun_019169 [Stephania yunnanensis]|uniref:Uncharacterized protein n=1 Tax=Stephania yunnanensis TaxID=152371 RepID=A0AAP0NVN9_9MAGN
MEISYLYRKTWDWVAFSQWYEYVYLWNACDMNTCVIRSNAMMWRYAHQKRVVRTMSSGIVSVCPSKESGRGPRHE